MAIWKGMREEKMLLYPQEAMRRGYRREKEAPIPLLAIWKGMREEKMFLYLRIAIWYRQRSTVLTSEREGSKRMESTVDKFL